MINETNQCCKKCKGSGSFNHIIGSHSDDRGGDSDLPCNCTENDCFHLATDKKPCECHKDRYTEEKKTCPSCEEFENIFVTTTCIQECDCSCHSEEKKYNYNAKGDFDWKNSNLKGPELAEAILKDFEVGSSPEDWRGSFKAEFGFLDSGYDETYDDLQSFIAEKISQAEQRGASHKGEAIRRAIMQATEEERNRIIKLIRRMNLTNKQEESIINVINE